jgi:hypothetical protein
MTEQEYTDLLDYLLTQLRELQMTEIAEEINLQINRGKTVTLRDTADLKAKNIKQSEVGKTQTLPLTSKEAFEIALDYLSKVITEVPSYAKNIAKTFGTDVNWEYDQSQSIKSLNTADNFSLKSLTFEDVELEQAKNEIQKIKNLVKE